jgi:hypothetical protein
MRWLGSVAWLPWAALCLQAQAPPPAAVAIRVGGGVQRPDGAPAIGAIVSAVHGSRLLAKTATDGCGTFLLGQVPPDADRLLVQLPDGSAGAAWLDGVPGAPVRLVAGAARSLHGVVQAADGTKVAAAFVAAVPRGHAALAVFGRSTVTAADGSFTLPSLPPGALSVRAWHHDHAGAAIEVEAGDATTVALTMVDEAPTERRFSLERTDDDTTPRHTARLLVQLLAHGVALPVPPAWQALPAGPDGDWHLDGWPTADAMRVQLQLADHVVEPSWVEIPAEVGDRAKVFAVATPPAELASLRGIVEHGGQLPGAGIALRLHCAHAPDGIDLWCHGNGEFSVDAPLRRRDSFRLASADPRFTLHYDPWSDAGAYGLQPPTYRGQHDPRYTHRPVLAPCCVVQGQLRDSGFGSLGDVHVALVAISGAVHRLANGTLYHAGTCLAVTRSAADGRIELPQVPAVAGQAYRLLLQGDRGSAEVAFDSPSVPVENLGELRLAAGGTVRGQVVEANGTGVPFASVRLTHYHGMRRELVFVADAEGSFVVPGLLPGAITLERLDETKPQAAGMLHDGQVLELVLR